MYTRRCEVSADGVDLNCSEDTPMRGWSMLFVLLSVIACRGATQPLSAPAGVYVLTAVNQHALPAAQAAGDSILSGDVVLHDNGTYSIRWLAPSYYFGTRDVIAATDSGSWSVRGSQLQFASTSGQNVNGSFDATSLSIQFPSDTWRFAKQ
jgi:hypothetical protein